ncbi:hypothetical protein KM043_003269 [Ampulex compressa]|nr:hypothetical protein KM043_003269 [Ampulex compressa]
MYIRRRTREGSSRERSLPLAARRTPRASGGSLPRTLRAAPSERPPPPRQGAKEAKGEEEGQREGKGRVLDGREAPLTERFPFQIRVVNAFRQGLDARYTSEHSSTTLAEVLRKQSSLSKRFSQTSNIDYADNNPDELTIPEIDVDKLSSHSHTETAV